MLRKSVSLEVLEAEHSFQFLYHGPQKELGQKLIQHYYNQLVAEIKKRKDQADRKRSARYNV